MSPLPTEFAPAERAEAGEVNRQRDLVGGSVPGVILDRFPSAFLILNRHRQVVYANRAAIDAAFVPDGQPLHGRRPGEILGCRHAGESAGGCGTTRFCSQCGAVRAILAAIAGKSSVEECRILADRGRGEEALDLRVWASPLDVDGEAFTLVVASDIADEKRREFLERVFLHDVLNRAGTLDGMASMVGEGILDGASEKELLAGIALQSRRLLRELVAHDQLVAAEAGELVPDPRPVGTVRPMRDIAAAWSDPRTLDGRLLEVDPASEDLPLVADPAILGRVLGSLVRNAIEASGAGEKVTLGCRHDGGYAVFRVHNPGTMPEATRLQVFQRSFSTKGPGRGLGTYSAKFLAERVMGGKVTFSSSLEKGTTFWVRIPLAPPASPAGKGAAGR